MQQFSGAILVGFCLALLVIPSAARSQDIEHTWSTSIGGGGLDSGLQATIDANGLVFVTGYFKDTVDFGGGPITSLGGKDIFVAVYDPLGAHLWSKGFGGTDDDEGRDVIVNDSGDVIITGQFRDKVDFGGGWRRDEGAGDLFIAAFDKIGSHLWSRRLGCRHHDHGSSLALDSSGNVYVIGEFTGCGAAATAINETLFGGQPNILVAKYDEEGTRLWYRRIGNVTVETGIGIDIDAADNVLITGMFTHSFSCGGGDVLTSAGGYDAFMAKFDSDFNHVWSQRVGGPQRDIGYAIAADPSGNVIVTGMFSESVDFGGGFITAFGQTDAFLAKYDPDGGHQWSSAFGSSHGDEALGLALGEDGTIFITGYFNDEIDFGGGPITGRGGCDIFLAQFTNAGTHLWSRGYGETAREIGKGVSVSDKGTLVVTGSFGNTVDFGGGPLTTSGYADIYVAAFAEQNTIPACLDIKPGSCDNPLSLTPFKNFSKKDKEKKVGVLPAAILGTVDLDVSEIDLSSVRLEGNSPLRHDFTDVGTPPSADEDCACSTPGPDGFMDLTLKFQKSQIASALGAAVNGDIVSLRLTGQLKDGTQFEATDCVRIVGGDPRIHDPKDVPEGEESILQPAAPNPFNPSTRIRYVLKQRGFVRLSVYDVTGRLVEQLVAADQQAGEYTIEWNASRIPSGIYFSRIEAGGSINTRKLILLK